MITLSIGENTPWKLTKESGYNMAKAICETGAHVISAIIDTSCPPTYVCVRFEVETSCIRLFKQLIKCPVDITEEAGA